MPLLSRLLRLLTSSTRSAPTETAPAETAPTGKAPPRRKGPTGQRPASETTGPIRFDYAPRKDGKPDPGEVVWAWVPYEENDGRGKDRPVLIVSRDRGGLLGLMLTSKDHDRDLADEARWGRYWMDVGTGAWDSRGRPSEVRLDRILHLEIGSVRREGSALDHAIFLRVAQEAQRVQSRRSR